MDTFIPPTEGQALAQIRREGHDMFFGWYLAHQRVRIVGAVFMRDAVRPWAEPILNVMTRALTRG